MNRLFFFLIVVLSSLSYTLLGCPLCVGRIKPDSPAFFSSDFPYHSEQTQSPKKKKIVDIYYEYSKDNGQKK